MPEKSKLKVRTSLPAKNHISKWVLEYQQKITFESASNCKQAITFSCTYLVADKKSYKKKYIIASRKLNLKVVT